MKVYRDAGLVIFARAPERGKVKTRLEGCFTKDECFALYGAMLRDVLDLSARLQSSIPQISVYWTASPPEGFVREFSTLDHRLQRGKNLGESMFLTFEEEFKRGQARVILIGCDSPTLPAQFLFEALDSLEGCDVVLGPSQDGGYYLIGESRLLCEPFEGIEWGSSDVFVQTVAQLERHNLKLGTLPAWYDLDRPEDLEFVRRQEPLASPARNVRAVLADLRLTIDD